MWMYFAWIRISLFGFKSSLKYYGKMNRLLFDFSRLSCKYWACNIPSRLLFHHSPPRYLCNQLLTNRLSLGKRCAKYNLRRNFGSLARPSQVRNEKYIGNNLRYKRIREWVVIHIVGKRYIWKTCSQGAFRLSSPKPKGGKSKRGNMGFTVGQSQS